MFFSENMFFKTGIVFLLALFFLIVFSHNGVIDYYRLSNEKQNIILSNEKIMDKNSQLLGQINRLKNDKEYIGHVARHEFGMAGADELVFRTIGKKKNQD